jgi:hypothetical protein
VRRHAAGDRRGAGHVALPLRRGRRGGGGGQRSRLSGRRRHRPGENFGYAFVEPTSTVQYCLPIARAWSFAAGDTVVAARVRDVDGRLGPAREIVVRVGR